MGIKGETIILLDRSLMRRFGSNEILVDPKFAENYVKKGLAKYKNVVPPNIKSFLVEEAKNCITFIFRQTIFPEFIIGNI